MKKIISIFTAVIISVLSLSVLNVSAKSELDGTVGGSAEIQSAYTSIVTSDISISGNSATCRSTVSGKSGVTKIIITQTLQKYSYGSWANYKPGKVKTTYGTNASYSNTYSSLSSGTYRTKTVVDVYKGSAYETIGPVYSVNGVIK